MGAGKTDILFSGIATTNSYVTKLENVLGFGETTLLVQNKGTGGSGVNVLVLGYPVYDATVLTSTYATLVNGDVIESGKVALYHCSDAYEVLGVAVKSAGTNFSCNVTVTMSRKRRV